MRFHSLRKLILIIIFQQLIFQSHTARAQFISSTIEIDRLNSSSRSSKLEHAILKLNFVEEVKTDLNVATAEITFTDGNNISIDELVKTIRQSGFCVKSVSAIYL